MTARCKTFVCSLALLCGVSAANVVYGAEANKERSVFINFDGVPRLVMADKETVTVGDLLDKLGYLSKDEYIIENVKAGDEISDEMVIDVTSTVEKTIEETEDIPFETVKKETLDLPKGEERVATEGVNGELTKTYKAVYAGKKLVKKTLESEVVSQEPVDEVIEVGMYEEPEEIEEILDEFYENNPKTINNIDYKYSLNVQATGYTPYDAGCIGITKSGTVAKRGSIAVDPSVIPMGAKLYIPGYGYGVAEDTGSAIKGNKIDLCYETKSEAFQWGRRNIVVYILQ